MHGSRSAPDIPSMSSHVPSSSSAHGHQQAYQSSQQQQHQQPSPDSSLLPSAVPVLKVMRLQSPELAQPIAGSLDSNCLLTSTLSLPDSFGVIHIGETFSAYLGALNVATDLPVYGLTVAAELHTPNHRWSLSSTLDESNAKGGVDVAPGGCVDVIVSRTLEEIGQHVLRVEVGYRTNAVTITATDNRKTMRKFYRFNVGSPVAIRELTLRSGDATCFVSMAVENISTLGLTIASATFSPANGLVAERVQRTTRSANVLAAGGRSRATDLFDDSGRLEPGESYRYLFSVRAHSQDATLRGIACGDELGKAIFMWRKAMGETGRIASAPILCPASYPPGMFGGRLGASLGGGAADGSSASEAAMSKFVVHGSGLSVDVAAAAANRSSSSSASGTTTLLVDSTGNSLDELLPVTVEPIDPPSTMKLAQPCQVQLLVVNHSASALKLQLQMRLAHMSGVVVCGRSFCNLGTVSPSGGSTVVTVQLVPLVAGLFRTQGCFIVDLSTGNDIPQPPLFHVFVEKTNQEEVRADEEKKAEEKTTHDDEEE